MMSPNTHCLRIIAETPAAILGPHTLRSTTTLKGWGRHAPLGEGGPHLSKQLDASRFAAARLPEPPIYALQN